jgi:hypothetical protein
MYKREEEVRLAGGGGRMPAVPEIIPLQYTQYKQSYKIYTWLQTGEQLEHRPTHLGVTEM